VFTHVHSKFGKRMVTIHPGEYFVSGDDEIIATVLGSCIAVAMYDRISGYGGLNHFMLPGNLDRPDNYLSGSGKYGMFAMELLINGLLKAGCDRKRLRAKVFGGGSVLRSKPATNGLTIPQSNIDFALGFLKAEGIQIESQDVGGVAARKVFFFPKTAKVLLKRLGGSVKTEVEHEEEEYLSKLQTIRPKQEDVTLF